MPPLYDLEQVRVVRTTRSNQQLGVQHLAISVGGVCSLFHARLLTIYLEQQLQTTVGCVYDNHQQTVHLFCFIITPLGCDAIRQVTGLLGPQGLKFAPLVRLYP